MAENPQNDINRGQIGLGWLERPGWSKTGRFELKRPYKIKKLLQTVEFHNSKHTGASGTAKLVKNKCLFVENRVRNTQKWQKSKVGPIAMWQLTLALIVQLIVRSAPSVNVLLAGQR